MWPNADGKIVALKGLFGFCVYRITGDPNTSASLADSVWHVCAKDAASRGPVRRCKESAKYRLGKQDAYVRRRLGRAVGLS